MKLLLILSVSCSLQFIPGCGNERQHEFYDNSNIILTAQNHPHGWTQSQCFRCHVKENIHRVDHYGDPLFSSAPDLVRIHGITICSLCHLNNGVQ
ncbi:MAG: hypothetical protein HYS98_04085 [Deltaproteobacteria bacterium]|nr:hypothetical protein [Deltaproteobacteria bacterium]